MLRYLPIVALVLIQPFGTVAMAADSCGLPLVYEDDFEKGSKFWQPTDPAAWKITETKQGNVFDQFQQSKYKPPHRSPYNIALLKNVFVGDFVLTVRLRSTKKDYGHRDMCLFFGYQDSAHFHYVHLGKKADPHANQIFIVNNAPRTMITKKQSPGTPWDDKWHTAKVVRRVQEGTIAVYFDDMKTPVMTAVDKTFTWGQVGLGSFDDTGHWDGFRLYGIKVKKPKSKPESKSK